MHVRHSFVTISVTNTHSPEAEVDEGINRNVNTLCATVAASLPYEIVMLSVCYITGGYPKLVIFNFLQSAITTWQVHEHVRWERHLIQCTEMVYRNICLKNVQLLLRYFFFFFLQCKTTWRPLLI
jgi:hypothetical protein